MVLALAVRVRLGCLPAASNSKPSDSRVGLIPVWRLIVRVRATCSRRRPGERSRSNGSASRSRLAAITGSVASAATTGSSVRKSHCGDGGVPLSKFNVGMTARWSIASNNRLRTRRKSFRTLLFVNPRSTNPMAARPAIANHPASPERRIHQCLRYRRPGCSASSSRCWRPWSS